MINYKNLTCLCKLLPLLLLLIIMSSVNAQTSRKINESNLTTITLANWHIRNVANDNETKKVLSFDNAISDALTIDLPYYASTGELGNFKITSINEVFAPLTAQEKTVVTSALPNAFVLNYYSAVIKKQTYTFYKINALRRNAQTNEIERLISFNVIKTPVNITEKTVAIARTYATNSVLASGSFIKYKVAEDGVYKLTYSELKKRGIDVDNINPQYIKLYGNGGGLLPLNNNTYRADDLLENAIYVAGENDGKFDSLDYVLFYGQKPHKWVANTTLKCKKRKIGRAHV